MRVPRECGRYIAAPLVMLLPFGAFAAANISARIAIHTDDGKLPSSFAAANLSAPLKCLSQAAAPDCSAWMMDVTDDGIADVLILDEPALRLYTEKPAGKWLLVGEWNLVGACGKLFETLRAGRFQAVTPVRPIFPDLDVAGVRFAFKESLSPPLPCPN